MRYVDLTGPDGNAFALIGMVYEICEEIDRNPNRIVRDMKSGYYDNLVEVFKRELEGYVEVED